MKYISAILAIMFLAGCSSKIVSYDAMGNKHIVTKSTEDTFHEQQTAAWAGYYSAIKNPPVIATIQQVDGTIITINSQVPPPAPVIRQHKNQIIAPVTDVIKYGIIGTAAYGIVRGVAGASGDISVNNSGDGTVAVDRSDRIASDSVSESVTTTDKSDHSAVSDPTVVNQPDPTIVYQPDPTIVTQPEPTIVTQPEPQPPIIIEKDVVLVEPYIPNE
jgi:hypothetical protein